MESLSLEIFSLAFTLNHLFDERCSFNRKESGGRDANVLDMDSSLAAPSGL